MTHTVRPRGLALLVAIAIGAGVGAAYVVAEVLQTGAAEEASICGERPCVSHVAARLRSAHGQ